MTGHCGDSHIVVTYCKDAVNVNNNITHSCINKFYNLGQRAYKVMDTALREGNERADSSYSDEMVLYLVHGCLHAAGENDLVEEDRKEMIAGISHDLRTPLTSIKGYVSGLIDGIADSPEKQQKYLTTIYNTAVEMDKLVDDLFLFSKLDLDRIPFVFDVPNNFVWPLEFEFTYCYIQQE